MTIFVLIVAIFAVFLVLLGLMSAATLTYRRRRGGVKASKDVGAPGSEGLVLTSEAVWTEAAGSDLIARVEEAFGTPIPPSAPSPEVEAPAEVEAVAGPSEEEAPAAEVLAPSEVAGPSAPETALAPPRLRDRLGKARALFSGRIRGVAGRTRIDSSTWEELEEALLLADVGVARTAALIDRLRTQVKDGEIRTAEELVAGLKADLKVDMAKGDHTLHQAPGPVTVWLFVGVNGVGKTTTIGKVAKREVMAGRSVVMAAGDTFRAAAAEQLGLWAQRAGAELVRSAEGGDPGSVIFDAVQRAAARGAALVLADTAGRLHTKVNLMEELRKVRRIAERPPGGLAEVLLVIDATTGQNGLVQARQFTEAVGVTGIVLTKLDGTAKGGIALAIQGELDLPIKLVGLGETAEDLMDFDPDEFVDALFD